MKLIRVISLIASSRRLIKGEFGCIDMKADQSSLWLTYTCYIEKFPHLAYLVFISSPEPQAHKVSLLDRTRAGVCLPMRPSVCKQFQTRISLRPGDPQQPNFIRIIIEDWGKAA